MFREGKKGYIGKSMSVRASMTYNGGKMPISKWTKAAIIEACTEFLEENEIESKITLAEIKKLSVATLKERFLSLDSWHHTGAFYQETYFYELNKYAFDLDYEFYAKIDAANKEKARAKKEEKENNPFYQQQLAAKRLKRQCKELYVYTKYKTFNGLQRAIESGKITIDDVYAMKAERLNQLDYIHENKQRIMKIDVWIRQNALNRLNEEGFKSVKDAIKWLKSIGYTPNKPFVIK